MMTVRGVVDAILRNLAIHLWELLPPDIEAEVDTNEDQVEEDGDFVMLDFSSSYLYEAAATRIMQYVEQSLVQPRLAPLQPPPTTAAVTTAAQDAGGMESRKNVIHVYAHVYVCVCVCVCV
jgi:hypothetical protein